MKDIIKILNKITIFKKNIMFYIESLYYQRDQDIVLFGSWFGERFADTTRYLFQYLSENKEKLGLKHVIWVTRNRKINELLNKMGYESYMMDSTESVFFHKKAKYHFICNAARNTEAFTSDILVYYSYGAIKINLWHGVMPMKGVAFASNKYKQSKQKAMLTYKIHEFLTKYFSLYRKTINGLGGWGDAYFHSTTPAGTKLFREYFLLPENRFLEMGNPRVCKCPRLTRYETHIVEKIMNHQYTVLYVPTFRSDDSSFDFYDLSSKLSYLLEAKDVLWIQKPHSAAKIVSKPKVNSFNILNLPDWFDTNTIMDSIDVLVTDYSSNAADAMFYKKQILYYMPDYEEYLMGKWGFVVNPKDVMISKPLTSVEEFKEAFVSALDNNDSFKPNKKYLSLIKKYWGDRNWTLEEIWEEIKKETC